MLSRPLKIPRCWAVCAGVLIVSIALSACGHSGVSTSDAEQAISDHAHGRLTDPECEDALGQQSESGERSFECSAVQPRRRRIKLMVYFSNKGAEPLIEEWPCLPGGTRWKALQKHPALRCGRLLPGT
jgi:hypothetical protein